MSRHEDVPAISPHQLALLKCLVDRRRLEILLMLRKGSFCVCDIVRALKAEQSLVSHHLQLLRKCGLVECEREGRRVKYRLASKQIAELLKKIDEVSQKVSSSAVGR
jgi:ArsR family transcriptional regulator